MVGTVLGNRYELLEKIGEGGTAVVYKAKCHLLDRFVAVKVLKHEFSSDEEFVKKFKREATAAASLSCNNIVNIYDVGTEGDISYIVLEYVAGKTLNEVIKENGRLEWEKAVEIAKQIAVALDCAHSNGIIHRDIKPHNILVTTKGLVKVTDFGIAKASNSFTITSTDKVMGSAHYLSPEQARGASVDCKTDIYSLGIVMYEMITGKVPFDAETPISIALKHIQEQIVPPIEINSSIPTSLNKIILKCVEKEPIKRYANVKELMDDFKNVNSNLEINTETDTDNSSQDDFTRVMAPIKDLDNIKKTVDKPFEDGKQDQQNRKDIDGEDLDEYDDEELDERDEPQNRKLKNSELKLNKKEKYIIGATLVGVVLIATLAIAYVIGLGGLSNVKPTASNITVPQIIGKNKDEAKSQLDKLNLKTEFINENSDKAVGTVTACDPNPGASVKPGDTIKVTISSGPKTGTVPDLSGNDVSTAEGMITQAGFVVGSKSYSYSDSVSKGCIISSDPQAGSKLAAGGTINLVISSGKKVSTINVPSVKGLTLDQAQSKLSGLTVNVVKRPTGDKSQDNIVYDQDPGSGESVKQGSGINIYVYSYDSSQDANAAAAAKALQNARDAVSKAQSTKNKNDIDNASGLVEALPDGSDKTQLRATLNSIQVTKQPTDNNNPANNTTNNSSNNTTNNSANDSTNKQKP